MNRRSISFTLLKKFSALKSFFTTTLIISNHIPTFKNCCTHLLTSQSLVDFSHATLQCVTKWFKNFLLHFSCHTKKIMNKLLSTKNIFRDGHGEEIQSSLFCSSVRLIWRGKWKSLARVACVFVGKRKRIIYFRKSSNDRLRSAHNLSSFNNGNF